MLEAEYGALAIGLILCAFFGGYRLGYTHGQETNERNGL